MGLLMALGVALAGTAVTPSWVDVPRGAILDGPNDRPWQVVHAPGDRIWRARCAQGPPKRIALLQDGRVLASDPLESAQLIDGAWTFEPSALPNAHWWLIDGPKCGLRYQALHTDPTLLDELEHRQPSAWELRNTLLAADAFAWEPREAIALDNGPHAEWWSRYLALRPIGGRAIPHGSQPYGDRIEAELAPEPFDATISQTWSVRGPATVQVSARLMDIVDPTTVCLSVLDHGQTACLDAEIRSGFAGDTLERAPLLVDGRTTSQRLGWRVYVPRGVHNLEFDRPLAARIRVADVGYLRDIQSLPTVSRVLALSPPPPPERWQSARTSTTAPTVSILAPATRPATQVADTSWLPLDALPHRPWSDDFGHLRMLLEPSSTPCTVDWDGARFTTSNTGRIAVFSARDPEALTPPTTQGCQAMLKVQGPLDASAPRHVLSASWPLGAGDGLDLDLPDAPRARTLLMVYLQADHPAATVTLHGERSRTVHLEASGPTSGFDLDGTSLHDAVFLQWTEPTVRITSDQPIRIRAIQPGILEADPEVDAPSEEAPATVASAQLQPAEHPSPDQGALDAVRSLTRTLATARDQQRADLLTRRASLLLKLGRPELAWRDLEAAEPLDALVSSGGPALQARANLLGQLWTTPVLPLDAGWTPPDLAHPLAREGRFTELARSATRVQDQARYWIEAARTQVPDATAPIEAMIAALDAGLDPDGPGLSPIRAWSRWRFVSGIRQARLSKQLWPAAPHDALAEALFVDDWPTDGRRVRPGRHDVVRWPGGAASTVQVRCRARSSNVDTCGLQRLDLVGDPIESWTLPADGHAHDISLPGLSETSFLQPVRDRDVVQEFRAPTELAASLERRVWRAEGTPSFHVLGPTVVEVEAVGRGTLTLRHNRERRSAPLSADGSSILRLPVRAHGTVQVHLDVPSGASFVVRSLVPGGSPLEPPSHMAFVAGLRGEEPAEPDAIAPITLVDDGRPRAPVQPQAPKPTYALLGAVSAGYGGSLTVDPLTGTFVGWRGQQRVGVQARPWRTPLWVSGEIRAMESSFFASVLEGRIGGEGWYLRRPLRLWASADGMLRGATEPGLPTVAEGIMRAGVGWLPRKEVELRLSVQGRGAARLGGWAPFKGPPLPEPLWTTYREQHRTTWTTKVELRLLPTSWLRVRGWASLLGNGGTDPNPLDGFVAMADVRATAPWLRGSVAAGWTQRFPDLHRDRYTGSLVLRGSMRGTAYTDKLLTVQAIGEAGWWPQWNRFGAEVGFRVVWAPREGLQDLRPSEEDVRDVAVWGRSERR